MPLQLDSPPERAESSAKSRLNLLDLPLDILKEVLKEITLTNDLTSLALTCTALHALAIPAMYSRFDIVWPEPGPSSEHPIGVDALSYGLATLVMGDHVFRELPPTSSSNRYCCQHCGCNQPEHQTSYQIPSITTRWGNIRFGNYYAQWTKKFSVGNGPPEWVQEYAITKETGKMLGTLVALAVARMVNLESFIWDMPTGVMRDVFLALASLGSRANHECRLEQVWIRWHDNSANNNIHALIQETNTSTILDIWQSLMKGHINVEYPTFSILPPLKSLTVLNLDEPAYLEEMATLIDRSRHKLTELRIGMAARCSSQDWVYPAGLRPTLVNSTPQRVTPGWPKHGGVLSILLEDFEFSENLPPINPENGTAENKAENDVSAALTVVGSPDANDDVTAATQMLDGLDVEDRNEPDSAGTAQETSESAGNTNQSTSEPQRLQKKTTTSASLNKSNKIMLEILELEHVVLSTTVLMKAIDWTRLNTLTLLHCDEHESLWRALRRVYAPTTDSLSLNSKESVKNYPFKLKKLHTDRISPYLMLFLKETIAPNTLEDLFFQEDSSYESIVPIQAIYKHILRRQRASLKRVLIDRSRRSEILSSNNGHWRQWMLPRDALSFVTSGRMPQLRELGIGMDRRDWHMFLQRLPNLPNLRALHFPNMFDPTLKKDKQRELALQILDIVALRPEIQLCYIGIETKCFQILEINAKDKRSDNEPYPDHQWSAESEADSEAEDQVHDHDSDNESDGDDDNSSVSSPDEDDGYSDEDQENGVGSVNPNIVFKLREILYYDDKVSIFKARHCSL
ncbi:hypothetical protein BGW36DRAFT_284970 [Talaromyces proteolyticus]|uniref:F-box domain-containing protein n=1 Tax=Talaromyces proteolyticus TaxID=1131652 RepID=A0AAD4L1D8_9EURO|nr:uncharacterized protein BGW36DRAFT_284970 [Talaromyces proteolyticus]KAH8704826.1 hypothetical protein BGW36DRAFT_284970 [Talaromyces proteolyticus]